VKQMLASEFATLRRIQEAYGALTVEQAREVAKVRSCPRCAGMLTLDMDPESMNGVAWADNLTSGRLVCLQGGHEIAEVRNSAL
jgi:hypothetical protein